MLVYAECGPMSPDKAPAETALLKIIIAGGFGVGKTTFVSAVSEIPPLTTEEYLTVASQRTDDLAGVADKTTTTVAMDFGRITLDGPHPVVLMLFGTPGQDRFVFAWDRLTQGSVGAVVLADTRRLSDSFKAVDYFEHRNVPFLVAVNQFEDSPHHYSPQEVREALTLPQHVPVLLCDARDRSSARTVLYQLVSYALSTLQSHMGAHT